ncbi:hypothetical protein F4805DRAFT_411709 [Annulohypoxylon moriforme]|nr:hypothetical protein F4805DRAFT_411709 [Annulohypoxylon moriforme]
MSRFISVFELFYLPLSCLVGSPQIAGQFNLLVEIKNISMLDIAFVDVWCTECSVGVDIPCCHSILIDIRGDHPVDSPRKQEKSCSNTLHG